VVADVPSIASRPLIAADALAFYIGKLFWPANLGFDYGRTPRVALMSPPIAFAWILPVIFATGAYLLHRRIRLVGAGAMVALSGLLPVLGFVPFTFQAYSTVADHYLYPSMIGVAMIVAGVVAHFSNRATIFFAVMVVLALAARSFVATGTWADSETLFAHAIAVNPRSFAAYTNRGVDRSRRELTADAEADFRDAIQINPDYAFAHLNLAELLKKQRDIDGAIAEFREVQRVYSTQRNVDPRLTAGMQQFIDALEKQRPATAPAPR
jgi:tetratricopeptide (TPR) repeat protein